MTTFNTPISRKNLPPVVFALCLLLGAFSVAGYRMYHNATLTALVAPDQTVPLSSSLPPTTVTETMPPTPPPAEKPVVTLTVSVTEASDEKPAQDSR